MSKLWGGRFTKKTDPLVEKFTKSIQFDYKLAWEDIYGSIFHVKILEKAGRLTSDEANKLITGLKDIRSTIENKTFSWDEACEDIHSDIQKKLEALVGDLVLKLHTARSRNDQIVFASKLYCKGEISEVTSLIGDLILVFEYQIDSNKDIILPGFTHLQHAQPIWLSDYLAAYQAMLFRDSDRLNNISTNIKVTMGAGALAGTPMERDFYNEKAQELFYGEFKSLKEHINIESTTNSLDAVSDRDFVIEIISALSILGMHLSRLSEDLIIWATKEFDFIEIDDAFCTGSSLMPQKKNPDVLELIRGSAGRLYGNLVSVLTMMKGLPLTYNRDMQLDKEPLFNSFEIISDALQVLQGLIKTLKFNRPKIQEHLKDESLYATDLVYYLVEKGVPFKIAHTVIGELVNYSLSNEIFIKEIPEDVLKEKFSDKIVKKEFNELFDPKRSVESKRSINREPLLRKIAEVKKSLREKRS